MVLRESQIVAILFYVDDNYYHQDYHAYGYNTEPYVDVHKMSLLKQSRYIYSRIANVRDIRKSRQGCLVGSAVRGELFRKNKVGMTKQMSIVVVVDLGKG